VFVVQRVTVNDLVLLSAKHKCNGRFIIGCYNGEFTYVILSRLLRNISYKVPRLNSQNN